MVFISLPSNRTKHAWLFITPNPVKQICNMFPLIVAYMALPTHAYYVWGDTWLSERCAKCVFPHAMLHSWHVMFILSCDVYSCHMMCLYLSCDVCSCHVIILWCLFIFVMSCDVYICIWHMASVMWCLHSITFSLSSICGLRLVGWIWNDGKESQSANPSPIVLLCYVLLATLGEWLLS